MTTVPVSSNHSSRPDGRSPCLLLLRYLLTSVIAVSLATLYRTSHNLTVHNLPVQKLTQSHCTEPHTNSPYRTSHNLTVHNLTVQNLIQTHRTEPHTISLTNILPKEGYYC